MNTQTTVNFFGIEVPAFTTLDAAWNNATPASGLGIGTWLTNGQLWIVMSENHALYMQIKNANLGWK